MRRPPHRRSVEEGGRRSRVLGGVEGEREDTGEETGGSKNRGEADVWVPYLGSWYRERDIEYDGCGKTEYREENLADQDKIFFLEDENRV